MSLFSPYYLTAYENGDLIEKANKADKALLNCNLCPRRCRVDRTKEDLGICKTGRLSKVASYNAHFGEEAPLVGKNGSGTIFFSHCNLRCNFCQNYDISHMGWGEEVTPEQLAKIMLNLQNMGCHNINLVTPSHVVPQILTALITAVENGLNLPIVYNTSGYDCINTLKLLDGLVDIYMPDFKFWDPKTAKLTCDAEDYPQVVQKALLEMHRQVGDLYIEKDGIARKGLLVRHLVMPENLAGTRNIMEFIVKKISPNTYVNIMSQYRPFGQAMNMKELNEIVGPEEFRQAIKEAKAVGITRLDGREPVFRFEMP
jgi:putative pyruvate formate lyase activating enzyme